MTTKQQQPQGKGEMRCVMCFKKLEEEAISIGCHRGEKMSKIQVTTTTSQQQQEQGKGEEQQKQEEEEEHLICKECAEIITEFTRKKKKEERVECPKCGKQVTIPKSGFVGVDSFTRVSLIKTTTTTTTGMEEICTFCKKVKMECLTCGMTSCCSDVCLSRVHEVHAALSKKMKHTAEMKNMSEESEETEETETNQVQNSQRKKDEIVL